MTTVGKHCRRLQTSPPESWVTLNFGCRGLQLQPPTPPALRLLESSMRPCQVVTHTLQVKLVDAGFIWTEPHSRRLKVKLTIQAEVLNGAILQQTFVVEYVVETHMCPDCTKTAANPNTWTACVQVGAVLERHRGCAGEHPHSSRVPSCPTGHVEVNVVALHQSGAHRLPGRHPSASTSSFLSRSQDLNQVDA